MREREIEKRRKIKKETRRVKKVLTSAQWIAYTKEFHSASFLGSQRVREEEEKKKGAHNDRTINVRFTIETWP